MDFNLEGMLSVEASSGVFAFFSIREAGQLLSNADATPISTFEGKKGEQKIRENNINTNKPQTHKTHKNQNKQNTNKITQKKKLAVTWRRTGQDRLSIYRAIN